MAQPRPDPTRRVQREGGFIDSVGQEKHFTGRRLCAFLQPAAEVPEWQAQALLGLCAIALETSVRDMISCGCPGYDVVLVK